jgi:hypothetical protein
MDIRRIEEALGRHSCSEALLWCSENKNALRKFKVPLLQRPGSPTSDLRVRARLSLTCVFKNTSNSLVMGEPQTPLPIRGDTSHRGRKPT